MSRLAEVVRTVVQPTRGNWQAWWTVATRAFNLLYKGHNVEVDKKLSEALAVEMGLGQDLAKDIVDAINDNMLYITSGQGSFRSFKRVTRRREGAKKKLAKLDEGFKKLDIKRILAMLIVCAVLKRSSAIVLEDLPRRPRAHDQGYR